MALFRMIRWCVLPAVLMMLLVGCGGSGGSSQNLTPISNPGGTTGTNTVTVAKTALAQSENTTITATFTKADGTAASGVTVNFTTTLGTLSAATATTDVQGKASVTLMAGTTAGQGQVTASATYNGTTYVKTGNFQVNLPPLHLSAVTLGAATLSYGGTTSVSVSVLDANNNVYTGQEVDVYFTSVAAAAGTATISSPVRTVNGVATTTFKALTLTGADTITATINNSSATAAVSVTPLSAGSITYLSATPTNLALKGTGGIGKSEVSTVVFKVLDSSGAPRPNTTVDFALNTAVGGLSLSNPASGSTGSDGTVSVQVYSGTIATPVRVTATVRGTNITTQSEQLVVSTGLPSQDGFSISIANLSPESWNMDGITTTVTARLSDHFHNPVPDGTAVYFTTSGGSIQPSCTTSGGSCSVTWTSQNPRPVAPQASQNGRAVILAYAIGEEGFLDVNGNGLADGSCTPVPNGTGLATSRSCGEFTDDSEAFRDDNENGIRDANETFIDFNGDGVFNGPDGFYNGVLQGVASIGAPKTKDVFSNSVLVMATSAASITNSCGSAIPVSMGGSTSCSIGVSDRNGNTMPSGTTVSFAYTSVSQGITLVSTNYTFPNSAAKSGVTLGVVLSDGNVAPATSAGRGIFTVTVTSPGKVVTTQNYNVN